MNGKGQTALEYMLMLLVVISLLGVVLVMINAIGAIGSSVGTSIQGTKAHVIGWLMV